MLNVTQIRPMHQKIHAAMIAASKASKEVAEGCDAIEVTNRKGDFVLLVTHSRHVPGIKYMKDERNGFHFWTADCYDITEEVISASRS